jgi:3-oxoisoapionate kinase
LVQALVARGDISGQATFEPLEGVKQTVVVSGSVSPTTERQIRYALQHGFEAVTVNAVGLACNMPQVREQAMDLALEILSTGIRVFVYTALGPASNEGDKQNAIPEGRKHIGEGLGAILRHVLEQTLLRHIMVAGGDSSSHALGQLDIHALTTRMPLPATPGSPLCTAYSSVESLKGLEIALKGGQVGGDDYFTSLRDGRV